MPGDIARTHTHLREMHMSPQGSLNGLNRSNQVKAFYLEPPYVGRYGGLD